MRTLRSLGVFSAVVTALLLGPVAQAGTIFQNKQAPPIALGTSGGNVNDFIRGGAFCQSGTLGALVQSTDGTQYILSNNHVLARENKGVAGDDISQPGLIDIGCRAPNGQVVADLTSFVGLNFKTGTNTADAAIARVRTDMVRTDGAILALGQNGAPGTVSNVISPDRVGCAVQKSGRTTGNTQGTISAVDVTVSVRYSGGTAKFTNQFAVTPGSFSAGGDSGSLIVRDGLNPRPVGLLFAGSSSSTIANPIGDVLNAFPNAVPPVSVSMVGSDAGNVTGDCPESAGTTQTSIANGRSAKAKHVDALMNLPSVVGVGVGVDGAIEIYLEHDNASTRRQIPAALENVPVRVQVTGAFEAR